MRPYRQQRTNPENYSARSRKRGDREGVGLRMKRDFRMLVSSKKKVKGLWKSCFECLMNGEEGLVTSMGIEACRKKNMWGENN